MPGRAKRSVASVGGTRHPFYEVGAAGEAAPLDGLIRALSPSPAAAEGEEVKGTCRSVCRSRVHGVCVCACACVWKGVPRWKGVGGGGGQLHAHG